MCLWYVRMLSSIYKMFEQQFFYSLVVISNGFNDICWNVIKCLNVYLLSVWNPNVFDVNRYNIKRTVTDIEEKKLLQNCLYGISSHGNQYPEKSTGPLSIYIWGWVQIKGKTCCKISWIGHCCLYTNSMHVMGSTQPGMGLAFTIRACR